MPSADGSGALGGVGCLTHALVGAMLLCTVPLGGGLAVTAEAFHQALDASCLTEGVSQQLTALLLAFSSADTFAFGAARLAALVGFGIRVVAAGAALLVSLEALHAILEQEEMATTLAAIAFATLASALTAAARYTLGFARQFDEREGVCDPPSRSLSRLATLGALVVLDGNASFGQRVPPTPSLLPELLRQRHAWAAGLLCALAFHRAVCGISATAHIFLQTAPPHAVPQLEERLARARLLPGVLGISEERFWSLDGRSTVGSLRAAVGWDADGDRVPSHLQRLFGDVVSSLTVELEREWEGLCCVDAGALGHHTRVRLSAAPGAGSGGGVPVC